MTKIHELARLGQAIWLDYIRRSFIENGEMQKLIDLGVRGLTSNPSIFEKAIAGSQDYDVDIERLAQSGRTAAEIYESLAIDDIRRVADLLRPLYDTSGGADGYVSLEVDPTLARNSQKTIEEARRLWQAVDRPNLMMKIPATLEGLPAITRSIADGINVNVTLIFSLQRYKAVMEAYLSGLELRQTSGKSLESIASVASFFISRLDSSVDRRLQAIIKEEGAQAGRAASLMGRAANANAKLAYQLFREVFESERFRRLQANGARLQRPLWASTSTKNPAYADILYVQELIGSFTVNTLPQNTLDAFLDHGEPRLTIEEGVDLARANFEALESLGISLESVTRELEDEGVQAFADAFQALLTSIERKSSQARLKQLGFELQLGQAAPLVEQTLADLSAAQVVRRIWAHDHTIWQPDPTEIRNRLGWLHVAEDMLLHVPHIEALVYAAQSAGYTQAVLLGMGGSSLAPEMFARTFPTPPGFLKLDVLDSTDPGAVLALEQRINLKHTLFIVSTKSGGTEETLSFFRYFYTRCCTELGPAQTGEHFVAITDPGSKLAQIAAEFGFRATLLNDPEIGGRYSALSYFGLLPAALAGLDIRRLLNRALAAMESCSPAARADENPGAVLGTALGALATHGKDKITLAVSPQMAGFGDWVEQLIAESTGKQGKGIVPVVGEAAGSPVEYGADRLFVCLALADDAQTQPAFSDMVSLGAPLIRITLNDVYDLGGQLFIWEFATAVAGWRLHIHPFDQPNVEQAKVLARQMTNTYKKAGALPQETPALRSGEIAVFGSTSAATPRQALDQFLAQARPGDYIAIQAFINPSADVQEALHELRMALRAKTRLATTLGFGPRFLHSTGQLHKGDSGNGLFIQFTASPQEDAAIPDQPGIEQSGMSFGVLVRAQAMGDLAALRENGRRTLRFHLGYHPAQAVKSLLS